MTAIRFAFAGNMSTPKPKVITLDARARREARLCRLKKIWCKTVIRLAIVGKMQV